jgi:acyl carrier protein
METTLPTGDERLREEQITGDERLREEQITGDERLREEQITYDTLVDWLTNRIAAYLNKEAAAIETDVALRDYGLDSVFALNLCADLEYEFGLFAQPTIAWDYPTIDAIAEHLTADLSTP